MTKIPNLKKKFKMAVGRHFEYGFIAIIQPESSDFSAI